MDSAALFSGGGGLGVTWGGDEELQRGRWHGWWAVVARGRGGADTTGRAASFVDLRLVRRIAGEEHGLSLEGGGTAVVYPEIGGGGGLALSYGTGGPAGLGLRFDATIYRTGGVLSGVAAVFSLGLVIGVAGYRD
jgi:hypothetical protein